MAGLVPLPPTVTHSSTRLTHSEAHALLSSFLVAAESDPSLRPDSQITPHAIQSQSAGSGGNLTLTHLSRILQGIEGKRVGRADFNAGAKRSKVNGEMPSSPPVAGNEQIEEMEVDGGKEEPVLTARETGGWQDKDDYDHAQLDETGDLPGRDPTDPNEADGIEQQQRDDLEVQSLTGQMLTNAEKEARKQAKAMRRKQQKREYQQKVHKTKS